VVQSHFPFVSFVYLRGRITPDRSPAQQVLHGTPVPPDSTHSGAVTRAVGSMLNPRCPCGSGGDESPSGIMLLLCCVGGSGRCPDPVRWNAFGVTGVARDSRPSRETNNGASRLTRILQRRDTCGGQPATLAPIAAERIFENSSPLLHHRGVLTPHIKAARHGPRRDADGALCSCRGMAHHAHAVFGVMNPLQGLCFSSVVLRGQGVALTLCDATPSA
jgi:hypothetical protein